VDAKFLESACEAYIIDNNLFDKVTVETLFKDIYKTLYHIREYDKELYNEVFNYSRINQQKLINEYFNFDYKDEVINEIISEIILGVLPFILFAKRKPISKFTFNILSKLGSFFDNIGNFISKQGRYWKFRYAIIQKNREQAYTKCEVDKDDLTISHYLNIGDKTSKNPLTSHAELVKQANCLREEYIKILIDEIELFLKSYFICLKQTGNFQSLEKIDAKNIISIISSTKLSNVCLDYYKIAKDIIKKFENVLDLVYDKNSKKQKQINELVNRIGRVKKEVQYTKKFNKYK
jgi:hypothetical protein